MAWKDEGVAFGCGVDREVDSSPGAAVDDASVVGGLIAEPSSLAEPAMLIKCESRLHQIPTGAQRCVDRQERNVVGQRGGNAEQGEREERRRRMVDARQKAGKLFTAGG